MRLYRGFTCFVLRKPFLLLMPALAGLMFLAPAAEAAGWIRLLAPRDKGYAVSVVLDHENNIYLCGAANQVGGESISGEINNIVVSKYGPDGRQLWRNRFGDGHRNECKDITLDESGNVYAASVSIDDKGSKAFIARYSPTGEALDSGTYVIGKATTVVGIFPDKEGNIYITGFNSLNSDTGKDAFIAKYDSTEKQVWQRLIPKPAELGTEGHAVAVDDTGVYVTGWIGSSGGTVGNDKKAFITKYSTTGYFGWMKVFSGKGNVEGNAIAIGPQGDLLIAGTATGDLPGNHGFGWTDAFLARYSKNGEAGWAGMFGTANYDYGYGAAFDDGGSMYLGGFSRAFLNGKESKDSFDLFLARYEPEGTHDATGAAKIPFTGSGGLVSPVFSGRITLNTGSRVSIYGTLTEEGLSREADGRWSVRRWLAGPEAVSEEKEKPGEAEKMEHLASFKMKRKSFVTRDIDEVGYMHNTLGKAVIFAGSVLALAGLLLLF